LLVDWIVIMRDKAPASEGGHYRVGRHGEVIHFSRDCERERICRPPGLGDFVPCTQGFCPRLTSVAPLALEEGSSK